MRRRLDVARVLRVIDGSRDGFGASIIGSEGHLRVDLELVR
jgi:hypothetical protein